MSYTDSLNSHMTYSRLIRLSHMFYNRLVKECHPVKICTTSSKQHP